MLSSKRISDDASFFLRRTVMKKIVSILFAIALMLSLVACGGSNGSAGTSDNTSESKGEAAAAEGESGEVAGLTEAIAESPILLTSAGQSADYQMIGTVMNKAGMNFYSNGLATSADIKNNKTLVVVVGGSSKGLGAAGIDADGELARLAELLDAAEAADMTIIAMHTGGEARRGDLSDKFITPVFERADYAIIVKEGDSDGMMTGICAEKGIPCDVIDAISDVATVLPAAFK